LQKTLSLHLITKKINEFWLAIIKSIIFALHLKESTILIIKTEAYVSDKRI